MRAYERLIRYAQVNTTSHEGAEVTPSGEGEWNLARLLEKEMGILSCSPCSMA